MLKGGQIHFYHTIKFVYQLNRINTINEEVYKEIKILEEINAKAKSDKK